MVKSFLTTIQYLTFLRYFTDKRIDNSLIRYGREEDISTYRFLTHNQRCDCSRQAKVSERSLCSIVQNKKFQVALSHDLFFLFFSARSAFSIPFLQVDYIQGGLLIHLDYICPFIQRSYPGYSASDLIVRLSS